MRKLMLTLAILGGSLAALAAAPSQANAAGWGRWGAGYYASPAYYYPGAYSSYYSYPGYYSSYYTPTYYTPAYTSYYTPAYSGYYNYYTPAYSSYYNYYTPAYSSYYYYSGVYPGMYIWP